ncbi:SIS domain-containing protein [Arthrobacter sp. UYEF20]|uniref:SIS domain-containing protein n=1 Tax=Arthrobacter sp. UYEF20 TaxID=1756363 RepID=UPI003397F802
MTITPNAATTPTTVPGAYMRAEIAEQPYRWLDLIDWKRPALEAAAGLIREAEPQLLVFAARGSSDHAAIYGQYLAHNLLGVPALLATPSTVTAFGTELRYPASVMLAVSQSGESPDLLDTVRAAKRAGVPIVAFTNNEMSPLAALGEVHVPLMAGTELSVAATKTYTAELLTLYVVLSLAAGLAWNDVASQVRIAVNAATSVLKDTAPIVADLAEKLTAVERILVVGRGYSMSTAKEGALKLMETNAIAASGWSAADATHGPLGQVVESTPVIVLTASPAGRDSVERFASAAAMLGGRMIIVGPGGDDNAEHVPLAALDSAGLDTALIPLLEIIPLQQLALALSLATGKNPDLPAGLNKVTKTL